MFYLVKSQYLPHNSTLNSYMLCFSAGDAHIMQWFFAMDCIPFGMWVYLLIWYKQTFTYSLCHFMHLLCEFHRCKYTLVWLHTFLGLAGKTVPYQLLTPLTIKITYSVGREHRVRCVSALCQWMHKSMHCDANAT